MFCKNCGSELAEGAKFCASCGAAAEAEVVPVAENAEAEAAAETPVEAPVEEVKQEAAPAKANPLNAVKEKLSPIAQKAKEFVGKNKLVLVGAAAILMMVLAIVIIVGLCNSGNGYIPYENAIMCTVKEEEVVAVWNNKVINTGIEASGLDKQAINLDGTVYAGLTYDGTLFVIRNKKVKVVSEDVTAFILSSNGKGIAYIAEDGDEHTLNLYNVGKKKSVLVEDEFSAYAAAFYGMALSPDGKSLAYYNFDEEEYEATLMLYNGKKNIKITASDVELIGLSNGAKQIYVKGENDDGDEVLYTYNKKGERTKIANCSGSTFYFNDDHTQILFYNDGKSYISNKGKEANKISSGNARMMPSSNSTAFSATKSTTYPVENLYGHVYIIYNDGQYNLWNIVKNSDKSVKLVSNVSNWKLDADAKYVYYVNKDGDLCALKISHGENASDKAKTIAEDVENYVVTSNRKKVYFISEDGLYSCNGKTGKGKKTIASEDVDSSLAINAKDVVYYEMDGDLYACSNGRKGSKVLSDSDGVMSFPNGIVLSADEEYIYITTGSKKLKKLIEVD